MSHILETTTTIQFDQEGTPEYAKQRTILAHALALVAQKYQGQVGPTYLDYYGASHLTHLALALTIGTLDRARPDEGGLLPRGIGLTLDRERRLTFSGDSWKHTDFYASIQAEITHQYTVLATQAALAAVCDGVQQLSTDGLTTHLMGVLYA